MIQTILGVCPSKSNSQWADVVAYDNASGLLYWKTRPVALFPTQHQCNAWNAKLAGKVAGSLRKDGYIVLNAKGILREPTLAHRIIWEMHHGPIDPKMTVDHRDRNKSNNRLSNLRIATNAENCRNTGINKNNTSGFRGVSLFKRTGRWQASITVERRTIHLGFHDTAEMAYGARLHAEAVYFREFAPSEND